MEIDIKGDVIMKISREKKKEEAIKRMKMLGLFTPCIKNFEKYDEVQLSEMTGGLYEFSCEEELNAKIKEVEEEYNLLVYHVVHTYTNFGEMYNFLCVTDYEEEWNNKKNNVSNAPIPQIITSISEAVFKIPVATKARTITGINAVTSVVTTGAMLFLYPDCKLASIVFPVIYSS